MRPLRIVMAMLEPPLPFGHPLGRWQWILLRGLAERGHQVTAFVACSRAEDLRATQAAFPSPAYDVRCHAYPVRRGLGAKLATLREPFSYMFSRALRSELAAALQRPFDLLHLEGTWAGWLGLEHTARAYFDVHNLFDIDLALEPPRAPKQWLQQQLLLRTERRMLRRYPNIVTLTPRLTARACELAPASTGYTVPWAIDLSLYPFRLSPDPDRPTLTLIGSFHWLPTRAAAVRLLERLWPAIRRRVPDARLTLVGRSAKRALAGIAVEGDVTLHEDVPDTIPYFHAADVMLYAPQVGSGMKIKVLEAFALGTAVVTNSEGVEGLNAADDVHAGIADDDAGLIERAVGLLTDPDRRRRVRVAARSLVEREHSPAVGLDRLERVYASILGERR